MKSFIFTLFLFAFALFLSAVKAQSVDYEVQVESETEAPVDVDASEPIDEVDSEFEPEYAVSAQMVVQGYEWGPAVPKVIVEFDDVVSEFNRDTFTVKTADADRVVLDVYNSNANGEKQAFATKYLTFELEVKTIYLPFMDSNVGEASPFNFDPVAFLNSWCPVFELDLGLADGKTFKVGEAEYGTENVWTPFKYNLAENYVIPQTANWEKDTFTLDGMTLQRASFTPEGAKTDNGKNPLIIWLHGAGEGGLDIDIVLLGNEVVSLAEEGIQKYFKTNGLAGAYVLALQNPTMWMDKGDGTYNSDIDGERQRSKYDNILFPAIQDYVSKNPDIDTSRIYLGGCSNGGYMTMNLMFEHGDYFTAFYPICEAYMNRNVDESMIEQAKNYNIWFIQSEDDTTVNPLETTIPSFYRLIEAGAQNVHFTLYDKVRGSDDPNAVYMGHYSWVYAFNDQVKKEFNNDAVRSDFENVTIEGGKVTSEQNYVTSANCNVEGNMWAWLSAQTKQN